jgi:hypothetical protein
VVGKPRAFFFGGREGSELGRVLIIEIGKQRLVNIRFAPTPPQRQREAFGPPEATYFTSASRMASGVS